MREAAHHRRSSTFMISTNFAPTEHDEKHIALARKSEIAAPAGEIAQRRDERRGGVNGAEEHREKGRE